MKTKLLLLLILFCVSILGYSQTFDNIPTGTGIYINKLIPSPSGSDLTNEYLEIRGTANAVIPSDLYFITIEGDGNSSSRGKVSEAVQLGDGTRTFGSNGLLAIVANYTDENTAVVTTNSYTAIIHPDCTVITIELVGDNVDGSSSSNVTSATPDIGYDGNFIDPTATYMIISSPSNPNGARIDGTTDSSDANGIINATGDHTSWVLYDSISYMDDDDVDGGENGEFAYGQIVYAQDHSLHSAKHFITTSAVIVDFATTSDANYILRQGSKTGYSENDWIVSGNGSSSSVPNWVFSTSSEKCYPDAFLGWAGINTVYGQLNPTAEALSVNDVLASKFKVYPNPARDYIQIESKDEQISSLEMFTVLGGKLSSNTKLKNNRMDISHLSSGMYLLKINVGQKSTIKRIIVQ
jgi:hypothetical protein